MLTSRFRILARRRWMSFWRRLWIRYLSEHPDTCTRSVLSNVRSVVAVCGHAGKSMSHKETSVWNAGSCAVSSLQADKAKCAATGPENAIKDVSGILVSMRNCAMDADRVRVRVLQGIFLSALMDLHTRARPVSIIPACVSACRDGAMMYRGDEVVEGRLRIVRTETIGRGDINIYPYP